MAPSAAISDRRCVRDPADGRALADRTPTADHHAGARTGARRPRGTGL